MDLHPDPTSLLRLSLSADFRRTKTQINLVHFNSKSFFPLIGLSPYTLSHFRFATAPPIYAFQQETPLHKGWPTTTPVGCSMGGEKWGSQYFLCWGMFTLGGGGVGEVFNIDIAWFLEEKKLHSYRTVFSSTVIER